MTQYGFIEHLSADFPSQFVIDVSEVCNYACIHCPHPEFKKSHHYDDRMLDVALHHKLIDEVVTHGRGPDGQQRTRYIRYTSQGEPLAHPKFFEMMEYASSKLAHLDVPINLTTNGSLLAGERARRLVDAGVDVVDISLDAYKDETYAKIRVGGDLKRVRKNVQALLKERARRPFKVIVSFVEQPFNAGEADDFGKFWKAEGCDAVLIRRLHSCSGAKVELAAERRKSSEVSGEARRPCLYPWERVSLGPDGYLHFCPQDWVHGSRVADYRNTTVRETWQGEFYTKLREAHLKNDYSKHKFCGQCPDWAVTQWPGQGKAYANLMHELTAGRDDDQEAADTAHKTG